MLEKNFVRSWQKRYAPIVITICFIPLLMDRYYYRLLPFFSQFLFIPNRNDKFMDRTMNCPTPCFNQFRWDLVNTWWHTSLRKYIMPFVYLLLVSATLMANFREKHYKGYMEILQKLSSQCTDIKY